MRNLATLESTFPGAKISEEWATIGARGLLACQRNFIVANAVEVILAAPKKLPGLACG